MGNHSLLQRPASVRLFHRFCGPCTTCQVGVQTLVTCTQAYYGTATHAHASVHLMPQVQTYTGISVRALVMVSGHRALLPREVPPTEAYMRQVSVLGMDSVGRCGEVLTVQRNTWRWVNKVSPAPSTRRGLLLFP